MSYTLYKLANDFGIDLMNPRTHNPALIYVKNIKLNRARELLARRRELWAKRRLLRRKNILKSRPLLDVGIHKAFNPDTGEFTYDYNSWKKLHNPTGDPDIDQRLDQDWIDTQKARAKYWGVEYEPGVQYTIPIYALGKLRLPNILTKITQDFSYKYSPERSYTHSDPKLGGRLEANLGTIVHLLGHNLTSPPYHPSGTGTRAWILNPYFLGAADAVVGRPLKPGTPNVSTDTRSFLEKQRIFKNKHYVYPRQPAFARYPTFLQLLAMQQKDPNITIVTQGADPLTYSNSMSLAFTAMRNIKATLAKLGHPYKQAAGELPILKFTNAMILSGLWSSPPREWVDYTYDRLAYRPAMYNNRHMKGLGRDANMNSKLQNLRGAMLRHFNRYLFLFLKPNKTPNLLKLLDRYLQVLPVLIETGKTKPQQNRNYMYG